MKRFLGILLTVCLILISASVAYAAQPHEYPTKDFYNQPIPDPKPEYIPDGTPIISMVEYLGADNFDSSAFINSEYGEKSSIWLLTNYSGYTSDMDEELLAFWKDKGVNKSGFNLDDEDKNNNFYVYAPADMETDVTYPLLIVSHGGGSDCFSVEGMGFINMIPEEKFILATAEDTSVDSLYAMYQQVTADYPVDTSRVYATGTSMGGMASIALAAAHPELIAAISPNDIAPSISIQDDQLAALQQMVVPMNFTTGLADKYKPYPLIGNDFSDTPKIDGYNRLLSAFGFDEYAMSAEEVEELVAQSLQIVEHATGLRFPKITPVNYVNNRLYVCDFNNSEGVTLLRINIVENKPHMFVGYDAQNAWNFLKGFARDMETGKLIVLE